MYTDIQVSRRLKPFFRHEPMTRDLFSRYVWIIDTLTRYGRLSRERLGSLWLRSSISNGQPLPERTFFHYRRSIEQNFHIDINCDESGQYYIDQASLSRNRSLTNLMLDNYAVTAQSLIRPTLPTVWRLRMCPRHANFSRLCLKRYAIRKRYASRMPDSTARAQNAT